MPSAATSKTHFSHSELACRAPSGQSDKLQRRHPFVKEKWGTATAALRP